MSTTTKLFLALYHSHSLTDALAALKSSGLKIHWQHAGNTTNNRAAAEMAQSAYAALNEGITNAFDAVIAHADQTKALKWDKNTPKSVKSALDQIEGPHADVYVQKSRFSGATVTILDWGTGMTEKQMLKGVLATGSTDKPANPIQHGNYGQGGFSIFGYTQGSLIASRAVGSDEIVFTFVYLRPLSNDQESYSYATTDAGLFKVNVKDLVLIDPQNQPNNKVFSAALMAEMKAKPQSKTIIFPKHGTIRRNLNMPIDLHHQSKDALYSRLKTDFFGSSGVIRIVGNGREGDLYKIRSARNQILFDVDGAKKNVGDHVNIRGEHNPTLKYHCEPTAWKLDSGYDTSGLSLSGEVDIELFCLDPYLNKKKELQSAVRNWLNRDPNGGAAGIIVTLNGQVHAKLNSGVIFKDTAMHMTNHTIVHVSLDKIAKKVLTRIISPSRHGLKDTTNKALRALVKSYIENGPATKKLIEFNSEMAPTQVEISKEAENRSLFASTMLTSKTIFKLFSQTLEGFGKGSANDSGDSIGGTGISGNGNAGGKHSLVPPVLYDIPTEIKIVERNLMRNKDTWVKVMINANDYLSDYVTLDVPAKFKILEVKSLKDGYKMFKVSVSATAKDAVFSAKYDDEKGNCLSDMKTMSVVDQNPGATPKAPNSKTNSNRQTYPTPRYIVVKGVTDPNYSVAFGCFPPNKAVYNYQLDGTNLFVYVNTEADVYKNALASLKIAKGAEMEEPFVNYLFSDLQMNAFNNAMLDFGIGIAGGCETSEFNTLYIEGQTAIFNAHQDFENPVILNSHKVLQEA